MGSSGKGGGTSNDNQVAGQNAYNAAQRGATLDSINANQPNYGAANQAGYDKYSSERQQQQQMETFMGGMHAPSSNSGYDAQAAAQAQAAEAARAREAARIADLTNKRDARISGYFEAANAASSFVTEKIAGEKANAALMGVDYNMTDELKGERISNYFSSLWSEGDQQGLTSSFGEIGTGGFSQSVFRGEGTETGPEGAVGDENEGGGIKPRAKSTLIDEENTLGAATALGA